jgi:hypothetical protein
VSTPSPTDAPNEYRDMLLALVEGEDPAEVQAGTVSAYRNLVDRAGDRVAVRPEPTEWSVLELVGHAVDAEWVVGARYRWVLAHDQPDLAGYDQDLWVDRLRYADDDPQRVLNLFGALRAANLDLWKRTPEQERSRWGMHAERGPESFDVMFRMLAGHDRFHLDQAQRALDAVLEQP